MKRKIINLIFIFLCFFFTKKSEAQIIPVGTSWDSLAIITPPNTHIYEGKYGICYYKPVGYNPATSPIMFFIHGQGGDGSSGLSLQSIADRQNALIVSPTMHNGVFGWAYVTELLINTFTGCSQSLWETQVIKNMYRHVLNRESRSSINCYLTGFSEGGQFVTRYMLIRQFSPDSIPIKMGMSVNPANYTLMTDTFNTVQMSWDPYRCGLDGSMNFIGGGVDCDETTITPVKNFICPEHVKQYYNENYGVLIGTADTQTFTSFCPGQGTDRYDRAKKFYAFSQSDAIIRGTTLKWGYDTVQGVGHSYPQMYTTLRNVTDTFTIAERLLFRTPFHVVQQFTPTCLSSVGVQELSVESSNIFLYPNPNNGTFILKIANEIKSGELLIFNSLGQEVYRQKVNQGLNNIYNTNLSEGLYHYVLTKEKLMIKGGKLLIQ